MTSVPDNFAELKQRLRASWMAGDFGEIAKLNVREGEGFIQRIKLKPGTKVLDVACGTGNQSIPSARAGADVIGLDLAPNLLEQARQRAAAENLKIEFVEGDAEKIPYEAARLDVVLSMFGAMFAPRPEVVASELLRVCRPGGLIAMGNWTPEGFVGESFKITSRYAPPPPGMLPPALWGVEKVVSERLGGGTGRVARLEMTRQHMLFDYPFPPSETVTFFRKFFGPTQMTYARLDEASQRALTADLTAHWTAHNQGDLNHTVIKAEYLEVHAHTT